MGPRKPTTVAPPSPPARVSKRTIVTAPVAAPQRPVGQVSLARGGTRGQYDSRRAQARAEARPSAKVEIPKRQLSSQRRDASMPVEDGTAARLSRYGPERERGVCRWLRSQRRDASKPVEDRAAAQLPIFEHGEEPLVVAQRSTRLPRPQLRITRQATPPKPRLYRRWPRVRSILKRPDAPKKPRKTVTFSDISDIVHTFETVEQPNDVLYYTYDRVAPRPVSWRTGTLNAPLLKHTHGSHATMWKSFRDGDEVITAFRSNQQRARVCQVQSFYRTQLQEDYLRSVTDSDVVEVKHAIQGFYGRKINGETETFWSGVPLDGHDGHDGLSPYAFGTCTLSRDGHWRYRSEVFQSHDGVHFEAPGRYQCDKAGNCVRFAYSQDCGCEGKWFVKFGTLPNLRTWPTKVVPSFPSAREAKITRGFAAASGEDGMTIVSLASSVSESIVTEREVAPPHPRPFVTSRRKLDYPAQTSRSKTFATRQRSRSPTMGTTLASGCSTSSSRSSSQSTSSQSKEVLNVVMQQIQQRMHQRFFG